MRAPPRAFLVVALSALIGGCGLLTAVVVAQGDFQEGIVAAPAEPAVLVVTWLGGMCDVRTRLVVEPTIDTVRITQATETRPGDCPAAGVIRSIAIGFDPAVAPGFVELVRG